MGENEAVHEGEEVMCRKCGAAADLYRGRCKACRAEALKQWRQSNADKVRAHSATPAQRKAQATWRGKNGEVARAAQRRWKYAHRQRMTDYQRTRRLSLTGDYDRDQIFERDGWLCQLCTEEVPRYNLPRNHPLEPTIDHRIALADGGPDTEDNVQLAHRACNNKKRPARVLQEVAA